MAPKKSLMLRLSLEPDAPNHGELVLRKGRRFLWIEDALEPLRGRLATHEWERLVRAVAATVRLPEMPRR